MICERILINEKMFANAACLCLVEQCAQLNWPISIKEREYLIHTTTERIILGIMSAQPYIDFKFLLRWSPACEPVSLGAWLQLLCANGSWEAGSRSNYYEADDSRWELLVLLAIYI